MQFQRILRWQQERYKLVQFLDLTSSLWTDRAESEKGMKETKLLLPTLQITDHFATHPKIDYRTEDKSQSNSDITNCSIKE
jgi:hypothetical protein